MAKYEMDDTKRLMSRVQKLLNLANDAGAAEGERDNAMRMAHAILAKHNLSMAEVEANDAEGQAALNAAEPRIDHVATFGAWPWATRTAQSVAELFFCSYLTSRGLRTAAGYHYFIGRQSNAITASLVAEYVVKSIRLEARRRRRTAMETAAFENAFCWGAMLAVHARVQALKKDAAQIAQPMNDGGRNVLPGTALVLASVYDTELQANRQFIATRWTKLRKGRAERMGNDGNGLTQGREFGRSVSLNVQLK
jgi:hypothetical protein